MIARSRAPLRDIAMASLLPGAASDASRAVPAAMANVRAIGLRPPPCVMRDVPGRRHDAVVAHIGRRLFELLVARGHGRSVCPSEVAQTAAVGLGRCWQELMPGVLAVARSLAAAGVIEAMQHEAVVDPGFVRGPVRLRFAQGSDEGARERSSATGSGEHATTFGHGHEGEHA